MCEQTETLEQQRVLPTVKINSNLRQRPKSSLLNTTTTTRTTTRIPGTNTGVTTTARTPSGESIIGSRVLPPVNVSDMLSKDQLRQHTERVYLRTVHKAAVPAHTSSVAAANTTDCKDATPTFVETVGATESDSVIVVSDNESGCEDVRENEMSDVSADVGSDNVDSMITD